MEWINSGVPLDSMCMHAKLPQSCTTLCDPMDSSVHGVLQAKILEWVACPSPGDLPNPGNYIQYPVIDNNGKEYEKRIYVKV